MERTFARAIADQVALGLHGRGSCRVSEDGELFASFGVAAEEVQDGQLVTTYGHQLLEHLGLAPAALLVATVQEVDPGDELLRETDHAILALGLRAVKAPNFR
jgi:hypothetical protein